MIDKNPFACSSGKVADTFWLNMNFSEILTLCYMMERDVSNGGKCYVYSSREKCYVYISTF
jgi:hypothetical protein